MLPGPPFRGVDWDDALEQLPAVRTAIARAHLAVELSLRRDAATRVLDLQLIAALHREVFGAVFPELAGRLRGPAPRYLPHNVQFPPYRGVAYEDVPAACEQLSDRLAHLIRQLDDRRDAIDPETLLTDILRVASFAHCELIRIHPFTNGNGRTARLCINYFAYRYGLLPLPFERPQAEYLAATAAWLDRRQIDDMVGFLRPVCAWAP
jgi:fido (protein-threonine AMPylation protein)